MKYKRLSRCGIENCKQSLFYADDGQWFCKNGHLREGELEVEADDEGFGIQGSRAGKILEEKERGNKILTGRRGFELYLECYQLILRKQVHWLIHEKGFPAELEIIVRDLWSLQLQKLSSTIPSATTAAESPSQENKDEAGYHSSSQSSCLYTSGSESELSAKTRRRRRRRRVPKASDRPKLIDSIGICYLGLVLLRVAVSLGDFHRWIEEGGGSGGDGGLIYQSALKEIPVSMKERLDADYWNAMNLRARPRLGLLHRTVHGLVVLYRQGFGVAFPPVNVQPVLFRYIRDLGLPLEIYNAVKRLTNLLSINFVWNGLAETIRAWDWPEARLMALVIIATKLAYGLDDITRTPRSTTEPAAVGLKWESWGRFLRMGNRGRRGLMGEDGADGASGGDGLEVDLKEVDVFAMKGEEMDKYMDWYEKTWVNEGETKLNDQLLNLFPPSNPSPTPARPTATPQASPKPDISALHSQIELHPANPQNNNKITRPGEKYLFYARDDKLPVQLQTLMQAAADILTISRRDLGNAVRNLDMSLRFVARMKRRGEKRKEGRSEAGGEDLDEMDERV